MIRLMFRMLALVFLVLALVLLVIDITKSIADSAIVLTPLGAVWFEWSASTLNLAQAAIQRYVHPFLWDPVIANLLLAPGWLIFGILALLCSMASRRRKADWKQRFGT